MIHSSSINVHAICNCIDDCVFSDYVLMKYASGIFKVYSDFKIILLCFQKSFFCTPYIQSKSIMYIGKI